MTDDRAEMKIARDAGLIKRHEQRLTRAREGLEFPADGVERTAYLEGEPVTDMVIPPDREVLVATIRTVLEAIEARDFYGQVLPQEDSDDIADTVLALLPTEAETKALVETATRLGRELGRREAAEEAAKLADELAAGVVNPEKPYNVAFVHACGVVARHIREIATKEPKAEVCTCRTIALSGWDTVQQAVDPRCPLHAEEPE